MSNKRFVIRALLLSVAFIAGVLGLVVHSYHRGERAGYDRGFSVAIDQRLSESNLLEVSYPIDDVIAKAYASDHADDATANLLKSITEEIKPETWGFVGGYGTIEVVKKDGEATIVIENSIPAHIAVSRFLDDLRGAALGIRDRSLVKNLYEAQSKANERNMMNEAE